MADASVKWSTPDYLALESVLRERAGLVFQSLRRSSIEAAAGHVMRRVGIASPGAFIPLVRQDGAVFDDLMAEVTIGETYFFREPGHFDLLRERILPEFRARKDGQHPFRVWSAGSSTGEEAYSIAIALQEEQTPGAVIGTDVSRARLSAARRARYRRWSFRSVPESIIQRYFHQHDDQFQLAAEIRRAAEFRYLNLASDCYPSMATGVWGMDVIFCRNVLIYFDRETVAHVAERLLASVADTGWILLGATDPPLSEYVRCEVVTTKSGLAYRRLRGRRHASIELASPLVVAPSPAPSPASAPERPAPSVPPPRAQIAAPVPGTVVPSEPKQPDPAPPPLAERVGSRAKSPDDEQPAAAAAGVRSLANAGRLDEAGRACAVALDRFRDNAELHYLHAILVAEAGQYAESARAAKRALYLDRSMVVAQLALGTALMRSGQAEPARRAFAAAERLLEQLGPMDVVPFSNGEPAARLLEMTRVQSRLAASGTAA